MSARSCHEFKWQVLSRRHDAEDIKSELLDMGICEVLIPLTASPSVEVQGNSAAALGNLSSKSELSGDVLSLARAHRRALAQPTIIPPLAPFGPSRKEVFTATLFVSSSRRTRLSSTLPSGLLCSCWNLGVSSGRCALALTGKTEVMRARRSDS